MVYNLSIIRKQNNRDFFIPAGVLEELYFFYNRAPNYKITLKGIINIILFIIKDNLTIYNEEEY